MPNSAVFVIEGRDREQASMEASPYWDRWWRGSGDRARIRKLSESARGAARRDATHGGGGADGGAATRAEAGATGERGAGAEPAGAGACGAAAGDLRVGGAGRGRRRGWECAGIAGSAAANAA